MSYSSDSGQVEPIAALAAVFAVGVGLSLYAGALDVTLSDLTRDRRMAQTAADQVTAEATAFGAVDPPLTDPVARASPTGYALNATLRTRNATWRAGQPTPRSVACERRRLGVRVAPGRVRPGILEVCAWRAL